MIAVVTVAAGWVAWLAASFVGTVVYAFQGDGDVVERAESLGRLESSGGETTRPAGPGPAKFVPRP